MRAVICIVLAICCGCEPSPRTQLAPQEAPSAAAEARGERSGGVIGPAAAARGAGSPAIYGGLNVRLRGAGDRAVLLLHGYGADGEDLLPLGERLAGSVPGTLFLMPEAPQVWAHGGQGRAWYERSRPDVPGQIDEARDALRGVLGALEERHGIPPGRVVYAGFSMGATMSVELAQRGGARPAGLVLLSGNALPRFERGWGPLRGLPVFVSHGSADRVLPVAHGRRLRDQAERAGAAVTYVPFEGGHAIPEQVVARLEAFLRGLWSP